MASALIHSSTGLGFADAPPLPSLTAAGGAVLELALRLTLPLRPPGSGPADRPQASGFTPAACISILATTAASTSTKSNTISRSSAPAAAMPISRSQWPGALVRLDS